MPSDNISAAYHMYCNPNGARRLSKTFETGKYDVLCARGKKAHESEGNRRFRALVKLHQTKYAACTCKVEKSKIVSHIVDTVRNASPNGGFIKIIDGEFWEAGDRAAKEKVGQTFRDLLHTKYSSSTKAKARARVQRKEKEPKQQSVDLPLLNVDNNMGMQQSMNTRHHYPSTPSSPAGSNSSVISEDSFSNHTDDSSYGQLSPTPQRSLYVETPTCFQPEPLSVVDSLRSSIQTIDARQSLTSSLRSSHRNSLLRSSILSLGDGPQSNLLRSSLHSFAPRDSKRDSLASIVPLPFLEEGNTMNIDGHPGASFKSSFNAPMPMNGIEKEFVTSMDLDDDLDQDLKEFYGSMGVAV